MSGRLEAAVQTDLAAHNRGLVDDAFALGDHARSLFDVGSIQFMPPGELTRLKVVLGHGSTLERWETPKQWCPMAPASFLNIDLRARIFACLSAPAKALLFEGISPVDSDLGAGGVVLPLGNNRPRISSDALGQAVLALVRYLLVCRVGPAGTGRRARGRPLDPSTIIRIAYQQGAKLAAMGLERMLTDVGHADSGVFCRVLPEQIAFQSAGEAKRLGWEMDRLRVLSDRGLWSDIPSFAEVLLPVTSVAGPTEALEPEAQVDEHLPLPDEYVAQMGRCGFWLIEEVGPSLLQVCEAIRDIWISSEDFTVGVGRVAQRRARAVRTLLEEQEWIRADGRPIAPPPFAFRMTRTGKNSRGGCTGQQTREGENWRPRTLVDIVHLWKLLQSAHLFVVGLSMGARKSELLTLDRNCLKSSRDGTTDAHGRTWKLVERHEGVERDWVLPDVAIRAIKQQSKLISLIDEIGTIAPKRVVESETRPIATHLWAQIGGGQSDRSRPMTNSQYALRSYAKALSMDEAPGGQSLRVHRFRKTIARLAGLALTQAPKVLMDVFGHKSIEMTLYYVLTDKDLQVDVDRVVRELRVMRATDTVEAMVQAEEAGGEGYLGDFGGSAAKTINDAIHSFRDRLHRRGDEWGAGTAVELAEILTLQGRAWQLVRPGVICTKFPGTESGPCNSSRGEPEPARCQSHCRHRLEEAVHRQDVDLCIREAVDAYEQAVAQQDELMQAMWAGQVQAHVGRFDDLKVRWMHHPTVHGLLEAQREAA